MDFDTAFDRLMHAEGGYSNDRRDNGGETRFGISKRSYPKEDIANLTLDRAKFLYRRDYWNPCRCDFLPHRLDFQVFDGAVHSGVAQSAKWLQQVLGAKQDGIIGPKTLAAAEHVAVDAAVAHYNALRLHFLTNHVDWAAFGRGWARRIADNLLET